MALVFMDLEMKPVDTAYRRERDICRQEVIQFGAVKLGEDLREIDCFRQAVRPAFGAIPPRYEQLTGITNESVAKAPDFASALLCFAQWCEQAERIYAWSANDWTQLKKEAKQKGLAFDFAPLAEKWMDFQRIFTDALGLSRELSLEQAVNIADLPFVGHQHDALWDARNTAELYRIYGNEAKFAAVLAPVRAQVNAPRVTSFSLADALGEALKGLPLSE